MSEIVDIYCEYVEMLSKINSLRAEAEKMRARLQTLEEMERVLQQRKKDPVKIEVV